MAEILMECKQLNTTVRLVLMEEQAPKFCAAFKAKMPQRTLAWHAVISGDNAGCYFPLVWTDFENPQERQLGDVFFYANGQLIVIRYQDSTEPGKVNKFAEVHPDSLEDMQKLGKAFRYAITCGEEPYFLDFSIA